MIIGTAGHIDHGKSALVRALTGIDPDRLKEEKARGITIELGFAHLTFSDGATAGIVDVPGHEKLVHNMLAGAGGIDMALIVVAADEGVAPQTIEHVEILDLLGVKFGVGAITKIDLVGPDERAVARLELEELLEETCLSGAQVVEVSSVTGEGLENLVHELESTAAAINPRGSRRPFRMPLDRVFGLKGFGTVVTGTPLAGTVRVGQTLTVLPAGDEVKVRSVEVHGARRDDATVGERIALNVTARKLELRRGFLLAESGLFTATRTLDCKVRLLRTGKDKPVRALKSRFYLGTSAIPAMVVPLQKDLLVSGGEGYVQVRTNEPLAAVRGDRFILRTEDDGLNLGGGVVIDAFAPRRGPKRGTTAKFLETIDVKDDGAALLGFVKSRDGGRRLHDLAPKLNLARGETDRLIKHLTDQGDIVVGADGVTVLSRHSLDTVMDSILLELGAYHSKNPLRPHMALAELRTRFRRTMLEALETGLRELFALNRVVIVSGGVRLPNHSVKYDSEQKRTQQRLLTIFRTAKLSTPSRTEIERIMDDEGLPGAGKVMESLVETGDLIPLTHELLVHKAALDESREMLLDHLRNPEGIKISQAREILSTTRKYIVPLFELLDRQGFTVRRGDVRILSPSWTPPSQHGDS